MSNARKPLNGPSWMERCTTLWTHEGSEQVWFETEADADAYDADPDNWAARYFGMSLDEYYEWVDYDWIAKVLRSHSEKVA